MTVDDEVVDLYLVHHPTAKVNGGGTTALVDKQNRRHLAYFDSDATMDPEQYFTPNLLGGSLEWDEDLSTASCGCDAAFYLVRMPAVAEDGSYDVTDGYYYCGSNAHKYELCPEFDVMEGNLYSWRTNAHSCDPPTNGFYATCDGSAKCGVDQYYYEGYGPGGSVIDTNSPFHAKADFNTDETGTIFTEYVITLT